MGGSPAGFQCVKSCRESFDVFWADDFSGSAWGHNQMGQTATQEPEVTKTPGTSWGLTVL